MNIAERDLRTIARNEHVHPEILEKSLTLLSLLDVIGENTWLRGKFALKGGTALNLFHFDAPRLSLDIDLNYVGAASLQEMQHERPILENELRKVYQSLDMSIERSTTAHEGGKYEIRYMSALNRGRGSIEVDLNYMYRVPLQPLEFKRSTKLGGLQSNPVLLVSLEETIAGKLSALFDRDASRDLFDVHYILNSGKSMDQDLLKTLFLAYYVMEGQRSPEIPIQKVKINSKDVIHKLRPVLRRKEGLDSDENCIKWAKDASEEVQSKLSNILALTSSEKRFLDDASKGRKLNFGLITGDPLLAARLEHHPKIQWAQKKKEGKQVKAFIR